MRVALYARKSTEKQSQASIPDQLTALRAHAQARGWTVVEEYSDDAVSGASLHRQGIQALRRDARAKRFDVVLTEHLDRLSRDDADTPTLARELRFQEVQIVTLAHGNITPLHVGVQSIINAQFHDDLADKTRRGLRGLVLAGKSAGGRSYGYRLARTIDPTGAVDGIGDRTIDHAEAAIVVRIFREYAAGASPAAIAKQLNAEGIARPSGGSWSPSTIHGHATRGTGILNNEAYIGQNVWNKQRTVTNPATGRRVYRPNPRDQWTIQPIPAWRIVPDDLWAAVKARQAEMRTIVRSAGNANRAHRPMYLFSGLTKCGVCGCGFVMGSKHRLVCSGRRERGICTNDLTLRRDELETRVLNALQTRFFEKGPFEVFCQEFRAALNEARMEHHARTAAARRELAQLEARRKKLVEAIMDGGVEASAVKDELNAGVARRDEIQRLLETTDAAVPLLHPNYAEVWRREITELREALMQDRCDPEARDAVRHMVEEIRLTPRDGVLAIDVKGDLAAMLSAASPTEDWQRQATLVAGACNQRYLQLWSGAA